MTDPSSDKDSSPNARFVSQAPSAEDVLKSQTVGLVQLADYKKRRAEALELSRSTPGSGASTPAADGVSSPPPAKKNKRKHIPKGKLSFAGADDEEEDAGDNTDSARSAGKLTPRTSTPQLTSEVSDVESSDNSATVAAVRRRLGPNASISTLAPKAKTKNALLKEAQQREQLRKEFLAMQEAVKATEVVIPFVFYDGANTPGGRIRVKKGDQIWLILDKARKVGAEMGSSSSSSSGTTGGMATGGSGGSGGSGGGGGERSRREWARISVDDLVLVRNDIILPHHYDVYHFLINRSEAYDRRRIFGYSAEPTAASPTPPPPTTTTLQASAEDADTAAASNAGPDPSSTHDPLVRPRDRQRQREKEQAQQAAQGRRRDEELEGVDDDPGTTKVVDRRWYERNKHIFPASVWEEFDASKDYSKANRRDAEGNSFFFS